MAHSTQHNQTIRFGTAHRGPAVEKQCHYEWTTSECEHTGNLIDELHIVTSEDATISHRYCTYIQDHSSEHERLVKHKSDRFVTSATASCESLAQIDIE